MNCTTITGESNFRHGQDDTAALRRCCRAFAHTVDQGGSEQVGAVGNWIGGGPAQRLGVLGPYAQILLFQPFLAIVCCCTSRLVPSTQFTFTLRWLKPSA